VKLAHEKPGQTLQATAAKLVKLVYFAGLTMEQAAETLGISTRTAYRDWAYARAWLLRCSRSGYRCRLITVSRRAEQAAILGKR
jgi:DNA-directed RNA polymerase specialized sigma24 family protein